MAHMTESIKKFRKELLHRHIKHTFCDSRITYTRLKYHWGLKKNLLKKIRSLAVLMEVKIIITEEWGRRGNCFNCIYISRGSDFKYRRAKQIPMKGEKSEKIKIIMEGL